jgi:FtsP/CotA-like multicopper oxidase with cupredoxin domain
MKKRPIRSEITVAAFGALFLTLVTVSAGAAIDGITGPAFNLSVGTGHISTPDGGSVLIWGYADGAGLAQYPGPTLIVNQGEVVTVTLTNNLTVAGAGPPPNVSMVFPGQQVVVAPADPGVAGGITSEAAPGSTVTYEFTATNAGTYTYYSGTDSALQVEMGLTGVIIVRPAAGVDRAYSHPDSQFDREYLFFLSEMDPRIHQEVEFNGPAGVATTDYLANYFPLLWFINGRNAPDVMSPAGVSWLPHQPYNCVPRMHPGEKLLLRVVGGGRDLHPFHHHGSHSRIIARDGRLLESISGAGPDLSHEVFTIQSHPGGTVDAIFEWTGKGLNWDIYGGTDVAMPHTCNGKAVGVAQDLGAPDFDPITHEYCPDHGKPFPVSLPAGPNMAFGGFYGGSPYLGTLGSLPPGEGGMNPNGGFGYMWHSHTEKEMTNYDIFPGGMMTMMIIEAPGVLIP